MHCVDLGESFQTHIYLQALASIQPRTSPPKFRKIFASLRIVLRPPADQIPFFEVDVLQEKYDEDAGEGDALALEDGEDPRADDGQKMMQKTMVEMDKWGEKKLPAVHVG